MSQSGYPRKVTNLVQSVFQLTQQSSQCSRTQGLWQLKLCLAYHNSRFRLLPQRGAASPPPSVLEQQFLLCLSRHIDDKLEEWQAVNEDKLRADLQKVLQQGIRSLAVVLMHAYT